MKVRLANTTDAARIAEIHVHAWQVAYRGIVPATILDKLSIPKRQAFWEGRIASREVTTLVAIGESTLDGWLVYGESRDSDATPGTAEIYGLYVDPIAWRSGTGKSLWNDARRRLLSASVENVTLWVLAANARAQAFYEAIGFRHEIGQVKDFARDGVVLQEIRYRIRL